MAFWSELKRRNVFKVGAAYAIVAWLLIQVAGQLMPTFEAPAWVLPVFTALVLLGFPLAIILAWAYELTPEGIKKTGHVPLERSITATTGQKLNYIVTGLLVVAVGLVVVDTQLLDRPSVGNPGDLVAPAATTPVEDGTSLDLPNVIAVLPFENLSPDADNAYFALGIHNEIINQLGRLGSINVLSRTSVMQYANVARPITDVARELGARAIVEGSVSYAGNRVAVRAQLVDAGTGVSLWSDSYDHELAEIFAIQADIAMSIANAIDAEFTVADQESIERVPTESLEAYGLYLRAFEDAASIQDVHERLDQALAIDPDFAFVHATKAFLYSQALTATILSPTPDPAGQARLEASIREHAEKALALDPAAGLASAALGSLYFHTWRWTEAREAYERAIAVAPSEWFALINYSFLSSYLGRHEDAVRLARQAIRLNPGQPESFGILGIAHAHAKDYQEAARNLRIAIAAETSADAVYRGWLIMTELARGDAARALVELEELERLIRASPQPLLFGGTGTSYPRAILGETAPAEQALEELVQRATDGAAISAGQWALAYVAVRDETHALEWLEAAAESARNHEVDAAFFNLMTIKMNVFNDPLLEQPEFVDVRSRIRGD